jgi:NO-binding membrane sensor protein with MHYT domain
MTVLSANGYAVALAAFTAVLLAHTTLQLAVEVSSARSHGGFSTLLLGSAALGFALWTTTLVRILAVSNAQSPSLAAPWLLVSLAVAVSSQACALFFVACREPDASNIAGTAFALAIGVGATRCAAVDELSGELALHDGLTRTCLWCPLSFLVFLAALWIWFNYRERTWQAIGMRSAAALAGAVGIFGSDAQALAGRALMINP